MTANKGDKEERKKRKNALVKHETRNSHSRDSFFLIALECFLLPFNITRACTYVIYPVSPKYRFFSDNANGRGSRSANKHESYQTPAIEIVCDYELRSVNGWAKTTLYWKWLIGNLMFMMSKSFVPLARADKIAFTCIKHYHWPYKKNIHVHTCIYTYNYHF